MTTNIKGPHPQHPQVALCLSGGGYRAMLFHAVALLRMSETGWLQQLDLVSSVSGGSIIAGQLAAQWKQVLQPQIIRWRVAAGSEVQDLGAGLVDAAPAGQGQDGYGGSGEGQHEQAQQAADLVHRQRDQARSGSAWSFPSSAARVIARNAAANMQDVTWRCQGVHLRTS